MVKFEKETTVGVIFKGKINMVVVSKYTTCDDVTEMVMYSSVKTRNYALFENAQGIERMLPRKSSVLKVIRSWGSTKGDVSLVVRKADPVNEKKIKISKAKEKLEKIRSLLIANKANTKDVNTTLANNLKDIKHEKKTLKEKCVLDIDYFDKAVENSGKLNLMKRYLNDVANTITDSLQDNILSNSHQCPADATYTVYINNNLHVDTEYGTSVSDLDTAFVSELDDQVAITTDLLNECMCSDPDTSDAESAFYESYSSEKDLGQNVYERVLEQNAYKNAPEQNVYENETVELRQLFDKINNGQSSYDTAMRSFMETLVDHPSDVDEGLSSFGSDL